MPNYKGHLTGGLVAFLIIFYILSKLSIKLVLYNGEIALLLLLCLAGAIFPDIDTKSKGQKVFYFFLLLITVWAITYKNWLVLSVISLAGLIPILSNHRNLTHRTSFIILVPLIIPFLTSYYNSILTKHTLLGYCFFVTGGLSHLILDFGFVKFLRRSFNKKQF